MKFQHFNMSSIQQQDTNSTIDASLPLPDIELAILPTQAQTNPPSKLSDPFLVTFTDADPTNPKDWPTRIKWTVTDVLSATGFNRIMVSTIMAPALSTIAVELHMSHIESVMALSIYLLATAFGPLVIGPLSEVYGRQKILHASNVWFLMWNIVCGFAETKEVLIAARFLAGFGASSIYALAGGVLGDVWRPEQRGKSLGVYLLIPLLGAAVGEWSCVECWTIRTRANETDRTDYRGVHGWSNHLALDVLVDFDLPGCYDCSVIHCIQGNVCTCDPGSTR